MVANQIAKKESVLIRGFQCFTFVFVATLLRLCNGTNVHHKE